MSEGSAIGGVRRKRKGRGEVREGGRKVRKSREGKEGKMRGLKKIR